MPIPEYNAIKAPALQFFADLMIQHNIGVSTTHAYEVKQIDSDYFDQA